MICSVIIPARNAARTLGECVLAVLSQSMPREQYEIIVVDDGSSDPTAAIARKLGAKVVPQPPLGRAVARNTGARVARGDVVVFLEPDCVPKLDWLARLVAPFQDPTVAGVKGTCLTHEEGFVPRLIQADYDERHRRLERYETVDVIDGYATAFRRAVFLEAGGFDPTFAAAEDVELSYRLAKSGRRLVYAPKAVVYHDHGDDLRLYLERALREGLWRSLVYARHPDRALGDVQAAPAQRAQLPLAGLTLATLILGARWPRLLPVAGLLAATFTSSTVPSAWRARRAGTDVALAIPGLRFLRALALGGGILLGNLTLASQDVIQRIARLRRTSRY